MEHRASGLDRAAAPAGRERDDDVRLVPAVTVLEGGELLGVVTSVLQTWTCASVAPASWAAWMLSICSDTVTGSAASSHSAATAIAAGAARPSEPLASIALRRVRREPPRRRTPPQVPPERQQEAVNHGAEHESRVPHRIRPGNAGRAARGRVIGGRERIRADLCAGHAEAALWLKGQGQHAVRLEAVHHPADNDSADRPADRRRRRHRRRVLHREASRGDERRQHAPPNSSTPCHP